MSTTLLPKPHPPRLQHSPSLPNIWFPPHAGPLPAQLSDRSKDNINLALTPPAITTKFSISLCDTQSRLTDTRATKLDPSLTTKVHRLGLSSNIQPRSPRKRGLEHIQTAGALTPSSSIRTTASTDSSATLHDEGDTSGDRVSSSAGDENAPTTRFLLVSHVSRTIPTSELNTAIYKTLTKTKLDDSLRPGLSGAVQHEDDRPVKRVYVRYVQSHGVVVIGFYDSRYCEAARHYLALPHPSLSHCVDQGGIGPDDHPRKLECQLVTHENLKGMIGDSDFLHTFDASFYLGFELIQENGDASQRFPVMEDNRNESGDNLTNEVINRSFKIDLLKGILGSYGSLMSFKLVEQCQVPEKQVVHFYVEYFDTRAADKSYDALYGKSLFGMKLLLSGREDIPRAVNAVAVNTPAPGTITSSESLNLPNHLYHNTRSLFPDPNAMKSVNDTPTTVPKSISSELKSVSPPYFYRTPASNSPQQKSQSIPSDGVNVVVQDHSPEEHEPFGVVAPEYSADVIPQGYRPGNPPSSLPHFYGGPAQDGFFYPPEANTAPMLNQYYGLSHTGTSPSPPFLPPPQFRMTHSPGVIFPQYDYDMQMQNLAAAMSGQWSYEQCMTLQQTGGFPALLAPNGELWCPPGTQLPPGMQNPANSNAYYSTSQPHHEPECTPPQLDVITQDVNIPASPSSSPTLYSPETSSLSPASTRGGTHSREAEPKNELRLEKIEHGLNTRTTVMIKNIPNKMSDSDLYDYISKVCPRRIDFMYLRMDFKNGCNVGYAFVNFITVQDLLLFARERLGQRWNMFSSEKVLEMRYANYQGKEALVEKFKNSCIMDEKESWRPKIYYSEPGIRQGHPEPFPKPTHMRRRERSSHNRGTLYVPNSSPHPSGPRRLENRRGDFMAPTDADKKTICAHR